MQNSGLDGSPCGVCDTLLFDSPLSMLLLIGSERTAVERGGGGGTLSCAELENVKPILGSARSAVTVQQGHLPTRRLLLRVLHNISNGVVAEYWVLTRLRSQAP